MKKTIFFLTILLSSMCIKAQTTKGNWMFGGSGDYSHITSENDFGTTIKYSLTTINPNAAYFIKDNWAIGSVLNYRNQKNDYGNVNTFGLGVLTKYYFLETAKIYNIFAQTSFIYAINNSDLTTYSQFYTVKVGNVVFFNNSVGLEFSLEYEKGVHKTGITSIIKAGIGFQIHLEKK
ncbi:hypothetical protein [uncultured Polaribacter sp.]|uniref:hypothetical protein n=1 Tax=uncultured Polaribacter sp. TaxID=174711 RepID=UPI002608C2BF|nr:hypothetical protein [uncultured Polaribacter sp.]